MLLIMKVTIDDQAIFGGPVSLKEKLQVGRPNIGIPERLLKLLTPIFALCI